MQHTREVLQEQSTEQVKGTGKYRTEENSIKALESPSVRSLQKSIQAEESILPVSISPKNETRKSGRNSSLREDIKR